MDEKKQQKVNIYYATEAGLIEIIQHQLSPAERKKLDYLLEKNEVDELTEAEQKEFLSMADQIESQGAERAIPLAKLPQFRNVEPKTLLDKFFSDKS